VLLLAGEPSGDLHAAEVARALKTRWPEARLLGTGGEKMASEGVELFAHLDDLAVMGFVEVISRLPYFWRLEREVRRILEAKNVDLVIPVDYPGFNLRMAERAHREGIPVLYYIAPQVWAWHAARARQLAREAEAAAIGVRLGGHGGLGKTVIGALVIVLLRVGLSLIGIDTGYEPIFYGLLIIIAVSADTGAYASGLAFGRHPMAPVISPKKTWEGFAGGALASVAAGVILSLFMLENTWWFGVAFGAAIFLLDRFFPPLSHVATYLVSLLSHFRRSESRESFLQGDRGALRRSNVGRDEP
jgi:hypothetical protein